MANGRGPTSNRPAARLGVSFDHPPPRACHHGHTRSLPRRSAHAHVRPLRHGRGHAERADGRDHAVPPAKRLAGPARRVGHVVAADAFREFDDRRAAPSRTHAVSRDRTAGTRVHLGARRHRAHGQRGRGARVRDRAIEAVSGCGRRAREIEKPLSAHDPVERRPGHARSRDGLTCRSSSIASSRLPLPARSSRTWRPTARRRSFSAHRPTRFCSSRTTRSTALARKCTACEPASWIGASARSAAGRISRIWWSRISGSSRRGCAAALIDAVHRSSPRTIGREC